MTANLLANGDFRQGLDAWSTGAPSDQTEAGVDLSPRWSLPGTPTAYLHAKSPGATAEISQEFALGAPAAQVQRVVLSGSVGTHRSTGDLIITALAKDGRVLGTFTHILPHRPSKPGGDKPESYDAFSCECPTPPGTARLRFLIRTGAHSGAKEPSRLLFFHSLRVQRATSNVPIDDKEKIAPRRADTADKMSALNSQVQHLTSELDLALAELAREQQQRAEAQRIAADSAHHAEGLRKQAAKADSEVKAVRADIKQLRELLEKTSKQLAQAEAKEGDHHENIRQLAAKLAESEKALLDLAAAKDAIATERDQARAEHQRVEAKLAEATDQAARYKASRDKAIAERDTEQVRADSASRELLDARQIADDAQRGLAESERLSLERDALKKKVAAQAAELAELRERNTEQEYRLRQVEEEIVKAGAHLDILKEFSQA